jgi:hypothetical protein
MTWKEQIVGAFGFGTAPFALHQSDADLGKGGHPGSQADGATREVFAREIARYARKYVSSENILHERLRGDSATLDRLWKISG